MTDDLIARLREQGRWYVDNAYNLPLRAADRIEELEAWKAAEEAHHHMLRQELASLTAEVERLRERLAEAYQIAGHIAVEYDGNGNIERLLDLLAGINLGDSHE